jgi:hypothetical protein
MALILVIYESRQTILREEAFGVIQSDASMERIHRRKYCRRLRQLRKQRIPLPPAIADELDCHLLARDFEILRGLSVPADKLLRLGKADVVASEFNLKVWQAKC